VRRALELLAGGGLAHFILEPPTELVLAALDQQARLLDRMPVRSMRADRSHARRQAPFDVVLEARAIALAVDDLVARSDAKQPMRQRHRPARHRRRHERPGVDVAVARDLRATSSRARSFVSELRIRIGLVVAQQDVEARIALLDQAVLERERLDHRIGDDDSRPWRREQRVDARAHARGARYERTRSRKTRAFPTYSVSAPREEQIDARLLGNRAIWP
jgi:hypothetical protein